MGTVVNGEGPSGARIMLVGQNPGREEARQGQPFVGRSGRYLDTVLRRNGLDRARLYITSVVKETTPRNRRPTAREIQRWLPVLLEEIERVRPDVIVLMGRVARLVPRSPGITYIETYHPAAAIRFPRIREMFEADFAKLGRSGEPRGGVKTS
jgi:uracil-DNA glycosylase family 4